MTNSEFVEKLLGIKLAHLIHDKNEKCHGLRCPDDVCIETDCKTECPHYFFWSKNVDWNTVSKNYWSMCFERNCIPVKEILNNKYAKNEPTVASLYMDTDSIMNEPIDSWIELPMDLIANNFLSVGEILDDASVHGLDFKYENGKYYYKDRP